MLLTACVVQTQDKAEEETARLPKGPTQAKALGSFRALVYALFLMILRV